MTSGPIIVKDGPEPETGSNRPSLAVLTSIEVRKMVDTRAGMWLLILIFLAAAGGSVVQSLAADGSDARSAAVFQTTALTVGLLLPIVGILLATSEWSQRTALITFVLTPIRERVVFAKFGAAILVSLVLALITFVLALLGGTFLGAGSDLTASDFGLGALALAFWISIGVALGLAFKNSPLAIVIFFVGPIAVGLVGAISEPVSRVTTWFDQTGLSSLVEFSTVEWDRLAVTVLVWIVVPLTFGLFRLSRGDID